MIKEYESGQQCYLIVQVIHFGNFGFLELGLTRGDFGLIMFIKGDGEIIYRWN